MAVNENVVLFFVLSNSMSELLY